MTLDEYNAFCRSVPHATHVVQWGGSHVWKVGGKVFAIAGTEHPDGEVAVTFKCSALSFEMLKDVAGCRPAPYLASRGMTWIQRTRSAGIDGEGLDDAGLRDYLAESHRLVAAGLTKKARRELGLDGEPQATTKNEAARRVAKGSRKP
jgi:predicted DNA-binding protein (MmcQ/YjbR family)